MSVSLPSDVINLINQNLMQSEDPRPMTKMSLVSKQLQAQDFFHIPKGSNFRVEQTLVAELKKTGNRLKFVAAQVIGPSRFCSLSIEDKKDLLELFKKTAQQLTLHIPQGSNFEAERRILAYIFGKKNPLHNLVAPLIGPSAFINLPQVDWRRTPLRGEELTHPIMLNPAGNILVRFIVREINLEDRRLATMFFIHGNQFTTYSHFFPIRSNNYEDFLTRFFTHQPCGQNLSNNAGWVEGARTLPEGRSVIELDDK